MRRPDDIPPETPTISYVNLTKGVVSLKWTANFDDDFETFTIHRRNKGGSWKIIKQTTNTAISDTLKEDGEFEYAVKATDKSGNESPYSKTHSFDYRDEFGLASPTNVEVKDSIGYLFLSWINVIDKRIKGYYIERQIDGENNPQPIAEHVSGESFFYDVYTKNKKKTTYIISSYDVDWYQSKPIKVIYLPK